MRNAARGLLVVAVTALGLALPRLFFDDAYITFRYASNIAGGAGFCYNPPERVLGVTTPLFTLLLAAAARLGFPIEGAALVLGLAGHALLVLVAFEVAGLLVRSDGGRGGEAGAALGPPFLAALACAFHPHLALTAVGGMETPLYCALLLATLLFASRGRPWLTGVCAGLALLTRPDAVLLAPPVAWVLWSIGDRAARTRNMIRAALAAVVVAGPWILFAWIYFGSPAPHSIEAKRLIHSSAPAEIIAEFGRFLRDDPLLIVALPLAAWGVAVVARRPSGAERRSSGLALALVAFMAIYLGAYSWSGITPFPWYVNPMIPPCVVLAVTGLASLAARVGLDRTIAWCGVSCAVGAALLWSAASQAPPLRADWDAWEGAYEETARFVLADSRPGDRVYVGEVGVIGYMLPGRIILDSSGINSPEITRIRTGRREDDPEWSRDIVRRLGPEFIATSIDYLSIRRLAAEEWFRNTYERVSPPSVEAGGQIVIFRRRRIRAARLDPRRMIVTDSARALSHGIAGSAFTGGREGSGWPARTPL